MNLPGRLRSTTLGDLLARLYRARLSGTLTLREVQGVRAGRRHHVHLRDGLVLGVDGEGDLPQVAVHDVDGPSAVRARLDALFELRDAELTFHVARPPSTPPAAPLGPEHAIFGRPRARDRRATASCSPPTNGRALATLGLAPSATAGDVRRAFRALALRLHPDRFPAAPPEERRALSEAFSRLAQAYHVLIA